jgi:hypothetical protein
MFCPMTVGQLFVNGKSYFSGRVFETKGKRRWRAAVQNVFGFLGRAKVREVLECARGNAAFTFTRLLY